MIADNEQITVSLPYEVVRGFERSVRELSHRSEDADYITDACYVWAKLKDEVAKKKGRDELKELEQKKSDIERSIELVKAADYVAR